MKLYIVTTGEYEDRTVEGVFSSREKADEFKAKHLGKDEYTDLIEADLDKPLHFTA